MFNPMSEALKSLEQESVATGNDKPKATIWLNIGVNVPKADGTVEFISLPVGIPLDNQTKEKKTDKLSKAKQALLDAFLAQATDLQAGESKFLPTNQLVIELRKTKGDQELPSEYTFSGIFG